MLAGQGSDYEEFKEMCTGKDLSTHAIDRCSVGLSANDWYTYCRVGGRVAGAVLSVDRPMSLYSTHGWSLLFSDFALTPIGLEPH